MAKIQKIHAREILDSRGNPTLEADVTLDDGSKGWAAVPSGASTGKYEAVELRDEDESKFHGKGVQKAVENVNTKILEAVKGMDVEDQESIDKKMLELDGTENKANLGANAILSVSLASARAAANSMDKPLFDYLSKLNPDHAGTFTMPIPMMNVMNGGKHGNWASDIQEYMIFPVGAENVTHAIRMCSEVYQTLKKILKEIGYSVAVGDEGGYAPSFKNNEEPFQLISQAIEKSGYKLGDDFGLGIDAAASEFYVDGKYDLKKEGKQVTSEELTDFYMEFINKYPIISMEDTHHEDDWDGFKDFLNKTEGKIQSVGDDLFVTNVKRLEIGIEKETANSILIKLNQIGTITETVEAILLARQNGMTSVVSHRSGETEDPFIADFVVAMGAGQIKTGAPARSERVAKYNQLIRIEEELGKNAVYQKWPF